MAIRYQIINDPELFKPIQALRLLKLFGTTSNSDGQFEHLLATLQSSPLITIMLRASHKFDTREHVFAQL